MRSRSIQRGIVAIIVGLTVAGATFGFTHVAGAAAIVVKPNSNLVVGAGTYAASVSAPKGTFPAVPDPAPYRRVEPSPPSSGAPRSSAPRARLRPLTSVRSSRTVPAVGSPMGSR